MDEIDDVDAMFHLVTELQGGGSWFDRLLTSGVYTESAIAATVKDLLIAVDACHSRGVINRSISSESIGYSSEESTQAKLFDFSHACVAAAGEEVQHHGPLDDPVPITFFTAPEVNI